MSPTKRFLLVFALVYAVLGVGGQKFFGPPGYSAEYMEAHKDGHERYLGITKSTVYKKYIQQGEAAPRDDEWAGMIDQVAFVKAYEADPEFQAESQRRAIYNYFYGFLNAGGLMLIAFRFGRAPILGFLDTQIAVVRKRLERAEKVRSTAAERLDAATQQINGLEADELAAKAHAGELMAREREAMEEATAVALAFIDQETEDRKRIAAEQAVKTLREELVNEAALAVAKDYRSNRSDVTESAEIDSFVRGLTGRTVHESVPK